MATWTPVASATLRHASIAAGVEPQSSWSFRPPAPARSCSSRPASETVLPLPSSSTLAGMASIASSISPMARGLGVQVVARVPLGRAGAAADQRRHAGGERLVDDLRADEVHVAVDAAGRQDPPLARDDVRARADLELRMHVVGDVRVAGLAEADDAPVAHADVAAHDAPVVEY